MNWMDRLRTSADEGLYSGRRSVVVVWWAADSHVCFCASDLPVVSRRMDLVERRRHYHFERRSAELLWRQVGLLTQLLQRRRSRRACVRAYVHVVCVCVYMCMYVCVWACIYQWGMYSGPAQG
jgi:hypothetical protein